MPDPIVMLKAAVLAAVVAAVVTWLTSRLSRIAAALGLGMGIAVGAWALGLAPKIPPREALDRFLLLLVPAALFAEIVAVGRPRAFGWASRTVVAALAAPVLVYGSSYVTDLSGPGSREWAPWLAAAIFAGSAIALLLVWTALARLANRAGRTTPLALAIAAGGGAIVVMLSGYATGGQLGLPLTAAIGVFAVVGSRQSSNAVGVAVIALFSLLLIGRLFAGLTTLNALIIFTAPLLAWTPELPWFVRLGPRMRGGLRLALTAIPVIIALGLAQHRFAVDSAGPASSVDDPSLNDYLNYSK
jgi:hypothetical protein